VCFLLGERAADLVQARQNKLVTVTGLLRDRISLDHGRRWARGKVILFACSSQIRRGQQPRHTRWSGQYKGGHPFPLRSMSPSPPSRVWLLAYVMATAQAFQSPSLWPGLSAPRSPPHSSTANVFSAAEQPCMCHGVWLTSTSRRHALRVLQVRRLGSRRCVARGCRSHGSMLRLSKGAR
jgi:hypothetical protein